MINNVVFQGNLTKDITLKVIDENRKVSTGTIALNIFRKNEKKTEFLELEIWGKIAEIAAEKGHKGTSVLVSGKFFFEEWTDKLGNVKKKFGVSVQQIDFLSRISSEAPMPMGKNEEDTEEVEAIDKSSSSKQRPKFEDPFAGFSSNSFDLPF